MARKQRKHSDQFKVAFEAIQGTKTLSEIGSQYNLPPNQFRRREKQLLTEGPTVFSDKTAQELESAAGRETELYEQIG
ncbi:MAG: hypothetical protein KDE28_29080 [Anaerolineales bacterium]|nr:hypothetical protein [Anaerolineales bacterium]MCB0032012.1 hypothetical protein [Anaerolineales bacterium]